MTAEARWRLLLAAYALVQMVLRVLIGPSLELDEAEAFLHGQRLAWGYGPQPPLYFWLQWGFLQVLGPTILALAALKAVLLGATLVLTFELMRRAVPTAPAGVAALSLSLLPQVLWESQRALTNSVLALALAVAAALLFLIVLERGRRRDGLLWGVVVGLAVLGKANAAVWAGGLLLAAALGPSWRGRLRPGPLAAAGLGAGAVLAGPVAWMLLNPDLATASAGKFGLAPSGLAARVEGLGSLLLATLSFLALAILVIGGTLLLGRSPGGRVAVVPPLRLLARAVALSLLLVAAGVLLSGATAVKDRWLLPFAWPLAPVAVAAVWPALTGRARTWLLGVTGGLWLLAAALLPYASLVDPGYRGADWSGLARALREEGAPGLPVETTSTFAAGNLLFHRFGLGSRHLARPGDLSGEAVLLLVPAGSSLRDEPGVTARTRRVREVEVRRSDRPVPFAILLLGPA